MPTIGGSVIQQGRRVPQREALVMGSRRWNWNQLDAAVATTAGSLEVRFIAPGDRVAIISANSPEFFLTYLAKLHHSGGVVNLNAMTLLGGTNVLVPALDPPGAEAPVAPRGGRRTSDAGGPW